MRRRGREQDQAGRRQHGARHRGGRARGAVAEALAEEREPDRRRDHRVDHGDRGQRRGQPRAPVGRLRQQQPGRRQRGDGREPGPQPAEGARYPGRVRDEGVGHGLGEHRGHPEGRTGGRRQQHPVQDRAVRAVRRHEQHRHRRTRGDEQQLALAAGEGRLGPAAAARQGQQPGQARGGQHRPAPGRGARPAPREDGRHRQGEDDGERAERLDQTERTVGQRHHVQQGPQAVQGHREPPAADAQGRVRAVRDALGHPLLEDRAGRVRDGRHQADQDRQGQCTHELHNARPVPPIPRPTGGHGPYSGRSTGVRAVGADAPPGSGAVAVREAP